jgi:hypothetical protein
MSKRQQPELTPERRQEILAWACKQTSENVAKRINLLIDRAIDKKLKKADRDAAKMESMELVRILKRRKGDE